MKLEDLLKAKGWTDQDIVALGPMLADPRFRTSLEESFGAVVQERDSLKQKDEDWERLRSEEWTPRVAAEEKKAQDLEREVTRLRTELKIAKDYGYITPEAEAAARAEIQRTEAAAANPSTFDPKKFVSMDDAQRMMEAEGRAIAMVSDLNNEYAYLNGGKSLYEYETEIDGRTLRGFSALREEAKSKRMGLDQLVSTKFDFAGKRQALKDKRQQEHDEAIRKDAIEKTRAEMAAQYGNPMMRTAVPSRDPFFKKPTEGGKPAWDTPKQQKRQERIQRAMQVQMTGQPVN
jgi:hypothetical protein